MIGAGMSVGRYLLRLAAVLLPVAVAVTGNQILNDGVWNGWSILIAVALAVASALVAKVLRRTTTDDTEQAEQPQPSPTVDQPPSTPPPVQLPATPQTQVQLNLPAQGGTVIAVQGGIMNVNHPIPPAQPPGDGTESST